MLFFCIKCVFTIIETFVTLTKNYYYLVHSSQKQI